MQMINIVFYYAGVGCGLLYSPSIVVVGQCFEKKRGFANGLSLAGSGIGSIAVPPVMVYTLNTYGLQGTLLIMGGMALNICVSGMLFRPPAFYMRRYVLKMERRRRTEEPSGDRAKDKIVDVATGKCASPIAMEGICEDVICIQGCPPSAQLSHRNSSQGNGNEYEASDDGSGTIEEFQTHRIVIGNLSGEGCHPVKGSKTTDRDDTTTEQLRCNAITMNPQPTTDIQILSVIDIGTHFINGASLSAVTGKSCPSEDQPCKKPEAFQYRLLINPILLIYCASIATAGSVYIDMFIMATPHAEQLGFSHTKAALLVSIMGGADVVSRVAFGFFADFKIVKTQHLFHASLAVSSVVLFILPSLKTYPAVASALVLFAVAGGGYISLLPTLLAEALGIERLPTTFGMAVLIVGFADIITSTLMGMYTFIHSRNC